MVKPFPGLKYLAVITVPLTTGIALHSQGWLTFITIVYVFGLVPLLELLFEPDTSNLSPSEAELIKEDPRYDWILFLVVPLQWYFVGYFLWSISLQTDTLTLVGRITAMGIMCGIFGINVAHELGHRKEKLAQLLSKSLLLSSLYMHFFIEHNRGHHKRVSTALDPASARYGENVYGFWIRSGFGSYFSAWKLEQQRLLKKGQSPWSWSNEMVWYQLIQIALLLVIFLWVGVGPMLYFMAAATLGILLLETVNYIEHYGLSRTQTSTGQYEKVQPHHSWNSNHVIGRVMLFELSRHSDHHFKASKKYQTLIHHHNSPQMPTGYPGMMVLALLPPAWFKLMHPLIAD